MQDTLNYFSGNELVCNDLGADGKENLETRQLSRSEPAPCQWLDCLLILFCLVRMCAGVSVCRLCTCMSLPSARIDTEDWMRLPLAGTLHCLESGFTDFLACKGADGLQIAYKALRELSSPSQICVVSHE